MTRDFLFDFPDFRIGTAEYADGPTGCTVFHFPKGALAAVDVRGGAAALRESDLLHPLAEHGGIDALVLTGGSSYGLDSASGVMGRLLELRGRSVRFQDIPSVPAAVVYDFSGRQNAIYPDASLGARAFEASRTGAVTIGRAGAGAHVWVGKYLGPEYRERAGQGAAFFQLGQLKIFALTVVNAVGNVLGRDGSILAGSRDPGTGRRIEIAEALLRAGSSRDATTGVRPPGGTPSGNTTISALVTNARVGRLELQRLAVMAHTAMGRVIEPFHTPMDGDSLFAISTGSVDVPRGVQLWDLGTIAGRAMREAVWAAFESE